MTRSKRHRTMANSIESSAQQVEPPTTMSPQLRLIRIWPGIYCRSSARSRLSQYPSRRYRWRELALGMAAHLAWNLLHRLLIGKDSQTSQSPVATFKDRFAFSHFIWRRTFAITQPEQDDLTQVKTVDRGRGVHRLVRRL